jgi:hypothetical protein
LLGVGKVIYPRGYVGTESTGLDVSGGEGGAVCKRWGC